MAAGAGFCHVWVPCTKASRKTYNVANKRYQKLENKCQKTYTKTLRLVWFVGHVFQFSV